MGEGNSIKKNAVFNMMYTALNILFPLITFPYASRILLAEGMGKVSFYTSVANYAMMLGSLGISTYGIRAVAKVREDKKELAKTIRELFLLNLLFSFCIVVFLLVIGPVVPKFREDFELLVINCIYVVLAPAGMDWVYSGLEQYEYITIRSFFCKLVSLFFLFMFVHDESDCIIYAMIVAFSGISAWIINFVNIRKIIGNIKTIKDLHFKRHFKPMILLFSSLLAVSVYTNLDTVMLGFITDDKQVGYYTMATKAKTVLLSLVNSISAVLLPRMSHYYEENKIDLFKHTIKRSISVIACIAIPIAFFFEISARETIYILGGEDYQSAIICMKIIMPILLISGFSNITGNQILIPTGNDKPFMIAVSVGAVVDIVLNFLFMPSLGAKGVAVATLIAELVQMSIQVIYARQYLNKNINVKYIGRILFSCMTICLIVYQATLKLNVSYLLLFFIKGTMFFSLYIIMLVITKDELGREFYKVFNKKIRHS